MVDAAEALEQLVGVRSALVDVSGLDEGTHHFEDLRLLLGGFGVELVGVVVQEGSDAVELGLRPGARAVEVGSAGGLGGRALRF